MKDFIELKYYKNSKHEIVFENLDEIKEDDNVVLRLKDGDLTPIFYLNAIDNLFIPYLPIDKEIAIELDGLFYEKYLWAKTLDNDFIYDTFKDSEEVKTTKNILPKWNIPEDNAVLFLSENDRDRYKYRDYIMYLHNELCFEIQQGDRYPNMSIIIPELHAEDKNCPYHIENINKVCEELKEKYGVERIELFVSHCFIDNKELFSKKLQYFKSLELKDKKHINNMFIESAKKTGINIVFQDRYGQYECDYIHSFYIEGIGKQFYVEYKYVNFEDENHIRRSDPFSKLIIDTLILAVLHNRIDEIKQKINNIIVKLKEVEKKELNYIDKITTTNSTGILEVQKSDRLEVMDVMEFF